MYSKAQTCSEWFKRCRWDSIQTMESFSALTVVHDPQHKQTHLLKPNLTVLQRPYACISITWAAARLVFDTCNVTSMCMKTHHERQKLFDLTMSCSTMTGQQRVHTPVLCHYLICSRTYTSHTHLHWHLGLLWATRWVCGFVCKVRHSSTLTGSTRPLTITKTNAQQVAQSSETSTLSKPWACAFAQKIACAVVIQHLNLQHADPFEQKHCILI